MTNYSFDHLSPFEFEMFSRDILTRKLGVFIESFGEGRDEGIDLRFSTPKGGIGVVQCKRYISFSSLFSNLKKELANVQKIRPDRYIIVTSASLLPPQKDKIFNLFKPFILNTNDILCKHDLNNILSTHKEILKNHHKLWLNSILELELLFEKSIHNSTFFVKKKVEEQLRLYVETQYFDEATRILKNYRYIILSGLPGVGKTTLASMLMFNILRKDEEYKFYNISESINDGFKMFDDGEKQVFIYDDFLGSSFLIDNLPHKEDSRILSFIEKVSSSRNKFLIFTTREYILNQARIKYEKFGSDYLKNILEIKQYTHIERARILCNHLSFYKVSMKDIDSIIIKSKYDYILNNKNYNPRLIETIVKNYKEDSSDGFFEYFLSSLNKPDSIWLHVFENQISENARNVLFNLIFCNREVSYDILYEETANYYLKCLSRNFTIIDFKKCLKELENSFIKTYVDKKRSVIITFYNSSITDFVLNYLVKDKFILLDLVRSIIFIDGFFKLFFYFQKKIAFKEEFLNCLLKYFVECFDVIRVTEPGSFIKYTEEDLILIKLGILCKCNIDKERFVLDFVRTKYLEICYSSNFGYCSFEWLPIVLKDINVIEKLDYDIIFNNACDNVYFVSDLDVINSIIDLSEERYDSYVSRNGEYLHRKAYDLGQDIFNDYLGNQFEDEVAHAIEDLCELTKLYHLDFTYELSELENHLYVLENNSNEMEFKETNMVEEIVDSKNTIVNEKEFIRDLFIGLKDNNI